MVPPPPTVQWQRGNRIVATCEGKTGICSSIDGTKFVAGWGDERSCLSQLWSSQTSGRWLSTLKVVDTRFPADDDNYTCVVNNDLDEAVKRHARLQVIGKLNELFGFMSGGSKDRWLKAVRTEGQITELILSLCYDSPLVAWSL